MERRVLLERGADINSLTPPGARCSIKRGRMNAGLSQTIHAILALINGPHTPPFEYRPYGALMNSRARKVTTPVGIIANEAQKCIELISMNDEFIT